MAKIVVAAVVVMHRVLRVRVEAGSAMVSVPEIVMVIVLHQALAAPRLRAVVHQAAPNTPATRRAAHARRVRVVVLGMAAHDAAVD